jgi:hypothetical protein
LARNKKTGEHGATPPGGGDPDPDSPLIDVPDAEIPVAPFIAEHVASSIGYPDGNVCPGRNITRAEVATIFFRLLIDELRDNHRTRENPFTDVQDGMWHNSAISVMCNMGILKGNLDGTFRPNDPITRGEFAAIAARFALVMQMALTKDLRFNDIEGHWAAEDIIYAAEIGWVNGYPDGRFEPNNDITRAEAMTLVNRMLKRIPETAGDLLSGEMIAWPDNADINAWYYLAVQEATNSHVPEHKDVIVPGLQFEYEFWVEMMPNRDWIALLQLYF